MKTVFENVLLSDLEPHPKNPRQGDVGAISEMIARNGWHGTVVVQRHKRRKNLRILAGEHRWRALSSLALEGWTDRAGDHHAYGDLATLPEIGTIPAYVLDCDDHVALRILLADNRASDVALTDEKLLLELLREINEHDDLSGTGFDGDDLDLLLADLTHPSGNTDADDVPAPPDEAVTVAGDLWELGTHRLVCGDARDRLMVELCSPEPVGMMWTDPPYGVAIGKKNRALQEMDKAGRVLDDLDGDATAGVAGALTEEMFGAAMGILLPGTPWYLCGASSPDQTIAILTALSLANAGCRHNLVWCKNNSSFSMGRLDYDYKHEVVWYGWIPGAARRWYSDKSHDTIFHVDRPSKSESHPTMKPVELIEGMLDGSSRPGDTVFDPFGGSGSTLIAAHKSNRKARLIELNPVYCDVICKRFEEYTGITPIRNGEEYSFL